MSTSERWPPFSRSAHGPEVHRSSHHKHGQHKGGRTKEKGEKTTFLFFSVKNFRSLTLYIFSYIIDHHVSTWTCLTTERKGGGNGAACTGRDRESRLCLAWPHHYWLREVGQTTFPHLPQLFKGNMILLLIQGFCEHS